MEISDIKRKLGFYEDALYQAGFEKGWESILETINQVADREWNQGNATTAEVIRKLANRLQEVDNDD